MCGESKSGSISSVCVECLCQWVVRGLLGWVCGCTCVVYECIPSVFGSGGVGRTRDKEER